MIPRARDLLVALALVACGTRPPPPAQPKPPDPKQLALLLHRDLTQLGEIARRWRAKCTELIAELRPHVARMQLHSDEVKRATRDAKLAAELKAEVTAYDEQARGLSERIGEDLAASYLSCKDNPELRKVIDQIPEL